MKHVLSCVGALLVLLPRWAAAESEADWITVLQSKAGVAEKCTACFRLRISGTARCVPALAAVLGEDRIGHAARNALEGLPFPEAGEALRAALDSTTGVAKAGLVDSLGWRAEAASVPAVAPLLRDPQPEIAAAAAGALGRIATPDAASALRDAKDLVPPTVRPVVLEAMLRAADRLAGTKPEVAEGLYGALFADDSAPGFQAAAGRRLLFAHPERLIEPTNLELFRGALSGTDRFLRAAALTAIRETPSAKVLETLLDAWPSFPPEAHVALLDASVRLGARAVPTARKAGQSPVPWVRAAGWQALADANDVDSLAALIEASVKGDAQEREVAREGLSRLRGEGVAAALVARLETAEAPVRVTLLGVLGERADPGSLEVLLRYAGGAEPTRTAALQSLAHLGSPASLPGLLDLAGKAPEDQDIEPLLGALSAACEASADRNEASRKVVEAMGRFGSMARRQTLPLLAQLGTEPALTAALAAAAGSDREVQKEAIQVLSQWPNASPAAPLLNLAQQATDAVVRVLALRGAVENTGQEPDAAARLPLLEKAMAAAARPEEKKLVLGRLGQVPTAKALALVLPSLGDTALAEEAALAAVAIAEKIASAQPPLAKETAAKVLAVARNGEVLKRAWALRGESAQPGPFLDQWQVCGPFRQAGVTSVLGLFDLPLGPEKAGASVAWKALRGTTTVALSSLFPGQDGCVAYLKCAVTVPRETSALLLMGSDDGIKAWLNGAVVHANNVDRGYVADQDAVTVRLKEGTNELLFKVTQGAGGWAAAARLVGPDGRLLPDLKVVPVPADVPAAQP